MEYDDNFFFSAVWETRMVLILWSVFFLDSLPGIFFSKVGPVEIMMYFCILNLVFCIRYNWNMTKRS